MTTYRITFLALLLLGCHGAARQPDQAANNMDQAAENAARTDIEAINRRIETAYKTKNADTLSAFYDAAITYIPEYKPVLYGAEDVKNFFTAWFSATNSISYEKKIYEVQEIAGYLLETGTFSLTYSRGSGGSEPYNGKYLIMWKRQAPHQYTILSEAFGAATQVKPEDMPYASVTVEEKQKLDTNKIDPSFAPILNTFDKGVVQAVLDGDGKARAAEFTEDGIYMPHFDPMQIGMSMIRPYMLKTYQKNVFTYDIDTYREIFATDNYVFLSGHFKVGCDRPDSHWGFEGNIDRKSVV